MRAYKEQAGVMLIEALIGILIFSIGILALLGMQGAAIKNTTEAKYRSEAALLASQIVGQMWVDKDNLGSYKTTGGPAAYPARDNWVTAVAQTLPGAIAPQIEVGADPVLGLGDNEVRVTVQWQQPGDAQTNVVRQFVILNRIHAGQT
ncbi:MAG TPA: type IV pilus modification protein PilV [Burkholderiales bacterium]|jgi:type IV pilus assembly protein PilV